MSGRLKWAAGLCLAVFVIGEAPAHASIRNFSTSSLIIPMDICYQPSTGTGGTPPNGYCPDPIGTYDDGIIKAYGLVYRMLAAGIKIYYIENANKAAGTDIDMNISSLSGTPVSMFDRTKGTAGGTTEFMTSTHTNINYRGAPFVIDASDYTAAAALIMADYKLTSPKVPQFKGVNVHYAKQNFTANVAAVMTQTPPKIALLNIGGAAIAVLQGYLTDAGLWNTTAVANYPVIGDVFTEFNDVTDFTNGGLINGNFQILWAPHWEGDSIITTAQRNGVMTAISAFVDAGNILFAMCAAIATIEGSTPIGTSFGSTSNGTPGNYMTTAIAPTKALATNKLPQTWPTGVTGEGVTITPAAMSNPLVQFGDFPFSASGNSWVFDFTVASGVHWRAGENTLISSKAPASEGSYSGLPIMTSMHKDNDPNKGLIIYLGGHSYGSLTNSCNPTCTATTTQSQSLAAERLVMNTLMFLGQPPVSVELSRSSPVLVANGNTYQGSYVDQSAPPTSYPPVLGHFREYPPAAVTSTNTGFDKVTANWDAADHIPAPAQRTIFTGVQTAGVWSQVPFTAANVAKLTTPMGLTTAQVQTAITGMTAAALGGVDHGIPAIIGPSPVVLGAQSRATVAYVSGLDGMLHAILVSGAVGAVTVPGTEIWAFIPPSQLSKIASYAAGVDGSPSVTDAFIDVGGGVHQWRTLLAITNGDYGGTVALLDISDPAVPVFKWEASDTHATYVMGQAKGAVINMVNGANGPTAMVYLATNNGAGSPGSGFSLYGLNASNGAVVWEYNELYTRHVPPTTTTLIGNDTPGTLAPLDTSGLGLFIDKLYFGDEEGKIWAFDALYPKYPTTAVAPRLIYDPGKDGEPIESAVAIYREPTMGHLSAFAVGGGADWVPTSVLSQVVAVDIDPISPSTIGHVWETRNLASGERAYGAPTVAGDQIFLATSFAKINTGDQGSSTTDKGALESINTTSLSAGNASFTTVASLTKAASEVAVSISASGAATVEVATIGGLVSAGSTVNTTSTTIANNSNPSKTKVTQVQAVYNKGSAPPFLISAWLDFR